MTFTNEGVWDRIVRLIATVVLGFATWLTWPGAWAMAFLIAGTIAFMTGLTGWCPMYTLFGISTNRKTAA
jgi:hypothetical protein